MNFFDLHCHPAVKTLFKERKDAISAWVAIEPLPFPNALESQCCLDQLCEIGMNLICFTRHTLERGMMDQILLRLAATFPFKKYMSRERLIRLAHGNKPGNVSYAEQMKDEWHNLHKKPPGGSFPNQKIYHLNSLAEYKEGDKETLYLIFNIEGGHIFNNPGNKCDDVDINEIKSILHNLQEECPMIFYFTPTHLTPNNLITHAYGNTILTEKPFRPNSFGICDTGYLVIEEIYKRNIWVDIKHMSLVSRQQFYKFREKESINKPIIASHVAFTGQSWEKLADRVTPIKKGDDFVQIEQDASKGIVPVRTYDPIKDSFTNEQTKFNPNSINLYDEDIIHVLESDGLIGIIFDTRILGASIKNTVTEFLSIPEYEEWCRQAGDTNRKFRVNGIKQVYAETEEEIFYSIEDIREYLEEMELYFPDESDPNFEKKNTEKYIFAKSEEHLLHFINQLLYIAKLCIEKKSAINPWKHICMGSDYDGIIASIYCCRKVTNLKSFARLLKDQLPLEAQKAGITMPTPNIDEFINDFFFCNAWRMLKIRFPSVHNPADICN